MSRTLTARAPAKLNLGLRVLARRPDGFHELESVFVPLDLHDRIALRARDAAECRVALTLRGGKGVPEGAENLAVRAARAFLDEAQLSLAVEIELEKRIPAGAGLGGGSSDAGTVLRLLSDAHPGALPAPRLAALALSLGADVPYFLEPRPARVGGIGERIEALPGLPPLALLLLNPGVPLATREVFAAFDALVPVPGSGRAGATPPESTPALALDNDLEPVAMRLCPGLGRLRRLLEGLAPTATGMSGSGPTLFGVFESTAAAERALAAARLPEGSWARVARTLECG